MTLHARWLCVWGALGACHEARAPQASSAVEPHNLGLAAAGLIGTGELLVVRVREAQQGGLDRNGDGDARDELVYVLDLERARLFDTGYAVASEDGPPPLIACEGATVAFAVDEAAQGARDLNGDGDALDRVLHVFEREHGTLRNLELAVRRIEVGGTLVAMAIDEAGQGAQDLDGDGDRDGTQFAVHDLADGSTNRLSLRDALPLAVRDGYVALRLAEREQSDLSLDGDDQDAAVFELYDGRTRLLHNTTLVLASDAVASAGGTFGVAVSEHGQGRGDLSGDGDDDDAVYFVYDPARGFSVSLGLAVAPQPAPSTDGEHYLLRAFEGASARDANADGDREDWVVHVFEPASGLVLDTGLAAQGAAALLGKWVAVSVSETMQGGRDLNGDGAVDGNVVHVFALDDGALVDLDLDTFSLLASGSRLFMAPSEDLAAIDWNQDGDQNDRVLFDWNARDGRTSAAGSVVGALLAVAGDHALVTARESERGGDQNDDGDANDLVLELHDARSGAVRALHLAAGGSARLAPDLSLAVLVDELAQGRDLNADGDLTDQVLFFLPPQD